jgi:hypothetical protein
MQLIAWKRDDRAVRASEEELYKNHLEQVLPQTTLTHKQKVSGMNAK